MWLPPIRRLYSPVPSNLVAAALAVICPQHGRQRPQRETKQTSGRAIARRANYDIASPFLDRER